MMMRKQRQKSPKITRELAAKIKYLLETTDLNHAQIAAQLGALNQGRISEIATGTRFSDVPPAASL